MELLGLQRRHPSTKERLTDVEARATVLERLSHQHVRLEALDAQIDPKIAQQGARRPVREP